MNVEHFVDTTILVYAHDKSAGRRHEIAKALFPEDLDNGRKYGRVIVQDPFQ